MREIYHRRCLRDTDERLIVALFYNLLNGSALPLSLRRNKSNKRPQHVSGMHGVYFYNEAGSARQPTRRFKNEGDYRDEMPTAALEDEAAARHQKHHPCCETLGAADRRGRVTHFRGEKAICGIMRIASDNEEASFRREEATTN